MPVRHLSGAVPRPTAFALENLVAKYDGRAPRYTSYPTAVQFTQAVDAVAYRTWLAAIPPDEPVSLYLHIPFCARLCWFCGCNTRAVNRRAPVSAYVDHLLREVDHLGASLPARLKVSAIHLGGGSPNMLSTQDLDRLFGRLGEIFEVAPDAEIAAELDPATLAREWVGAAVRHGLNRASLGVQNLDPVVQQAVNRFETFEDVAAAVEDLRSGGVASVNIDLMYGLPHQTCANTLATLDKVLLLEPERVALFGYAHVPWAKAHQQLLDERALPGAVARLDQAEAAAERLADAGYIRVGLDHFARSDDALALAQRDGRLHRNFQGYTTDAARTLLGLGASAISSLPQGFAQNIAGESAWRAVVNAGDFPIARGVVATAEDRFRGEIIERLMCDLEVDLAMVCKRHERPLADLADDRSRLAEFVADGLIELEGDRVAVTELGRLAIRSVCAVFARHLAAGGVHHARAL